MREEEAGDEDVPGLPEAAEDLADEMAVAALSRTISMQQDSPAGELITHIRHALHVIAVSVVALLLSLILQPWLHAGGGLSQTRVDW